MPIIIDPIAGITFPDNTIATYGGVTPTGLLSLPSGTTAQRPTNPTAGMIRFNTTLGYVEYYDTGSSSWLEI